MKHFKSSAFKKAYAKLPPAIQSKADKQFELLKSDMEHPSLHLKPVGELWSARVDLNYRVLAMRSEGDFIWFWIGNHDEYDRLLN